MLMIIIPFLNGYFIGNINPTFSDKAIFVGYPKKAAASKNKSIRTEATQSEKFQARRRKTYCIFSKHPCRIVQQGYGLGQDLSGFFGLGNLSVREGSLSNVQHPASRTLELVNNVKGSQPSQKMSEELPGCWISLGAIRCKLIRRVFSRIYIKHLPIPIWLSHPVVDMEKNSDMLHPHSIRRRGALWLLVRRLALRLLPGAGLGATSDGSALAPAATARCVPKSDEHSDFGCPELKKHRA